MTMIMRFCADLPFHAAGGSAPEPQKDMLKISGVVVRATKICDDFEPQMPLEFYANIVNTTLGSMDELEAAVKLYALTFDIDQWLKRIGRDHFCFFAKSFDAEVAKEHQ
jgi:hypothetical protein